MPSTFTGKDNFAVGDVWMTNNAGTNSNNLNDETLGNGPYPHTLVALKAHAVNGDAGTGKPNNGASANDAAFGGAQFVTLGDGTRASWNGTAWVVFP